MILVCEKTLVYYVYFMYGVSLVCGLWKLLARVKNECGFNFKASTAALALAQRRLMLKVETVLNLQITNHNLHLRCR